MDNIINAAFGQRGPSTSEGFVLATRKHWAEDLILEAQKPRPPRPPEPDFWGELSADLTREAQEKLATDRSKQLQKSFPSLLTKYDVDRSQTLNLNEVRTATADQSLSSSDRAMLSFMEKNHDKIRKMTNSDNEPNGI